MRGWKNMEAFRASEIRYRRLFETAHDGVLLLDPGTRKITDANPFMTRLLGYSRGQLVGKELFEIGLLKDEVASQEMFRKLKRKHEVRYEDLPLESPARPASGSRSGGQSLPGRRPVRHPMQHPRHHGAQGSGSGVARE